ncbi:hypothetical protein SUDANB1_07150 [Streptomyces sp. enrichment culture]|uniref:hypothetical protein n=1 Tax=Streptomyces sp. enrichment culture TaxID=1795815 RepID=UPI003F54D23F
MPSYAVNALIEFPVNGTTARATRSGHINTALPATEEGLRGAIATQVAEQRNCRPDEVTFVEFTFTELPTA